MNKKMVAPKIVGYDSLNPTAGSVVPGEWYVNANGGTDKHATFTLAQPGGYVRLNVFRKLGSNLPKTGTRFFDPVMQRAVLPAGEDENGKTVFKAIEPEFKPAHDRLDDATGATVHIPDQIRVACYFLRAAKIEVGGGSPMSSGQDQIDAALGGAAAADGLVE